MKPLISVIMPVAAAHVGWLPRALACFHAQTYEPKELILVRQVRAGQAIEGYQGTFLGQSYILSNGESLGDARNFACRVASGEIIAHMDVDDWYEPDRLELQYRCQISATIPAYREREVVAFCAALFHDLETGEVWCYQGRWSDCVGASLMYRRSWWQQHPFQPKRLGEDSAFANIAAAAGVYASMPADGLMVARRHGANTCKYKFVGDEWTQARYEDLPDGYRATLEVNT